MATPGAKPAENGGGGGGDALIWPETLSPSNRAGIDRLLGTVPADARQELLDELRGAQAVQTVRNPIAYVRTLCKAVQAGGWVPQYAEGVRIARNRALQSPRADQPAEQKPAAPMPDELVQRLPENLRRVIERRRNTHA